MRNFFCWLGIHKFNKKNKTHGRCLRCGEKIKKLPRKIYVI